MEQYDLIPFTAMLSSLLLCKRCVSSSEVINFASELSCFGLEVDDDWSIDELSSIVCMSSNYSFGLKDDISYDTELSNGDRVFDVLVRCSDERIIDFIIKSDKYRDLYNFNMYVFDKKKDMLVVNPYDTFDGLDNYKKRVKKKSLIYSILGGIRL